MNNHRVLSAGRLRWLMMFVLSGCGGDAPMSAPPPDTTQPPAPPPPTTPGPHFSVLPIPLEQIARIMPLGHNNKTMPNDGTYWFTCDESGRILQTTRPCLRARLPIRAPRAAVVHNIEPGPDGTVNLEGPAGLFVNFGHVTPAAGLTKGDSVRAGDAVATMFYDYGFDVNVYHTGIAEHPFANKVRYPIPARFAQHAIEQYAEPLRSQLTALIQTTSSPAIGRLSWDIPGTASGAWFLQGTPFPESMTFANFPKHLFLGRIEERQSTRLMAVGSTWPGQLNPALLIDDAAPSWDQINAASGVVALKAWAYTQNATPNLTFPQGTILVQLLSAERLRIEWFNTHGTVTAFTAAARVYER